MRKRAGVLAIVSGLVSATAGLVAPSVAHANVSCGQTITTNTVLTGDVGPCANGGIIVGADNITLDLNGYRVFGTAPAADGVGIYLENRRGVTVKNGWVTDFDGGVVIRYGRGNTVTGIKAYDNLGSSLGHPPATGTSFGDGIAIQASTHNSIVGNEAVNNGPFSGIGIYQQTDSDHPGFVTGPAGYNLVDRNIVRDNNACRASGFCDNDGIRVEPNVARGNVISNNVVTGSGLDGISLFGGVRGTLVIRNIASDNGVTNDLGDGIRVFGPSNIIQYNQTDGNASGGVSVARRTGFGGGSFPPANPNGRGNVMFGNTASGNGIFDLWDSNPNCVTSLWRGNSGTLVSPPCTLN
ncbi:MAG: right-handed parallel beta-helix repeat-containing protein [Actinomycetota bacterium]|jgi:parallel beta-helix repeat protein